ncbi:porin [Candidatus Pelagibacter sp.]|nr:porin [Candidatus Pelagibacter sp.]
MNNLRKIGLSALAGSLATFSAHAADVSVSGAASISFDDTNRGGNEANGTRGNGFYMGDSLKFNMSGETDGGLGVAVYYEIDGGALDDYDMTLSGDWGSLKFNGSGTSSAFGAVDDITPNAYEEAWDIVDDDGTATTGSPTVINGGGGDNMFIYTSPSMGGATFSAAYQNDGGGATVEESYTDFAIAISPEAVEGLTVGYASSDNQVGVAIDSSETTMYAKYAVGSFTIGVQSSDLDHTTANSDMESFAYGITYAVNDDLSIGYSHHELETELTTDQDQESTGISASYTMGGMTIAGASNETDNIAGTSTRDTEGYEFTLSFAF